MIEEKEIMEALKTAREKSKKRKFTQTWDLIINLKNIDLSKPENRFSGSIILPNKKGKKSKICVITNSLVNEAKKLGIKTITRDELKKMTKKEAKKIADEYDYFLGEASLMPDIGRILGPVLGPRGKMPKPFPPGANLKSLIESGSKTFNINVKTPVIQGAIGSEDMKDEELTENIMSVLNFVESKLPKGKQQIKDVYVKLTMGSPAKVK
ncbi:MAG: 50S ribosomal protein L1 [Candidatus Aenigmarchaeota archaeon]|nr:50S ribosomal protein L1 [Candidatus Aenigmarchaeota archaeon]